MIRWVIDAAHGGKDKGVIGTKGILEKDYNLIASNEIIRILQSKGEVVYSIREGDNYIDSKERINIANELKGDIYISIHLNGGYTQNESGTIIYINSDEIYDFASGIKKSLLDGFYSIDKGIQYYEEKYYNLKMPYLSIIGEYITNERIVNTFNPVKYGQLVAKGIYNNKELLSI